MAFESDFIDEIKLKVNIVDVVSRVVNLKKSGVNNKGLCPFHSEKSPSFNVNEEKQIFNCFGCGQKGDVITFVQKYYNLSFMEACEKLCNENGIKMPENFSNGPKIDYNHYYEINSLAARFFFEKLTKTKNPGYAYIRGRGISDNTIVHFGLGYAPDSGHALVDYLKGNGVEETDIIKLGLANQGKGGLYDKFRNRLIFPIFNPFGKVVGFGGRALGDIKPKYLNSAESDIFLKKNNLYALNFTKKEISDLKQGIIVEGYMDVISLYQAGVKNVAASLGTALTENQAKLLCRYTKNIILSYDSDSAGITAATRGIDVIHDAGGSPRVLRIPEGKDPDDYIKNHGKEDFYKLTNDALYGTDFKLDILRKNYDLTNRHGVIAYLHACEAVLRGIKPVEQDIYIKKLSEEFGVSESAIAMEIKTADNYSSPPKPVNRGTINNRRQDNNIDRNLRIELSLAVLCMYNVNYLKRISEDRIQFKSALGKKVLSILTDIASREGAQSNTIEEKDLYMALDPDEEKILQGYIKSIKLGPDDEAFYLECRSSYRLSGYKEKRLEILSAISEAEVEEDADKIDELAAELMRLDNNINQMTEG